jgi:hypothetical protein
MKTLARTPYQERPYCPPRVLGTRPQSILIKGLLACGVLYALLYAFITDVVAAELYAGYSRSSQAISELSATGSPTRALLTAMGPLFTALQAAFGIGVWKSAWGERSVRATGGLLVAHAATFPLWVLAPMTSRAEIGASMPLNDIAHITLSAVAILFILLQIGFGAQVFGTRFRLYSLSSAVTVLVFGALTGMQAPAVAAGEPTPWIGLFERISFAAWLLWLAVLAVALLRRNATLAALDQGSP